MNDSTAPLAWMAANEGLAEAVLARRTDRAGLVDRLAYALEESCVSLPIIENGEDLDDICPFTFFASFCRPMDDQRRSRLVACLLDALDVDAQAPASFEGLALVDDRHARFFSRNHATRACEIERLWDVFAIAMRRPLDRPELDRACGRVASLRAPGRALLPIALSWVRPRAFEPPAAERSPESPEIDAEKTAALLDAFRDHLVRDGRDGRTGRAVARFQACWDEDAPDFAAMLARSLKESGHLLFRDYYFNPLKEVLAFAQEEPETTRGALKALFDEEQPLVERICRFEAETARLFERHRGSIAHAVPRRSSHGNYHAICVYLFLRHPGRHHLFSPRRMKALSSQTGCTRPYRVAQPDVVLRYAELCDALVPFVFERDDVLGAYDAAGAKDVGPAGFYQHVLIDDLAVFACSRQGGVPARRCEPPANPPNRSGAEAG